MCSPRYQQLLVCNNNQVHKSVKHTTLSLCGGLAGWRRRLEERVAVCHTLRPRGPLDTCLRPQGHDRPRQLVCFGEVQAETERIWGCGAGGWDYRWAAVDRREDGCTGGGWGWSCGLL